MPYCRKEKTKKMQTPRCGMRHFNPHEKRVKEVNPHPDWLCDETPWTFRRSQASAMADSNKVEKTCQSSARIGMQIAIIPLWFEES